MYQPDGEESESNHGKVKTKKRLKFKQHSKDEKPYRKRCSANEKGTRARSSDSFDIRERGEIVRNEHEESMRDRHGDGFEVNEHIRIRHTEQSEINSFEERRSPTFSHAYGMHYHQVSSKYIP